MKKLLICKDNLNNTLISTQLLEETENIRYSFEDNPPIVEERENEIGNYVLLEDGKIGVEYLPKPKTQLDLIQEQLKVLLGKTNMLADDSLVNMELNLSTDEKLDKIDSKLP